jgi:hypothetical protein
MTREGTVVNTTDESPDLTPAGMDGLTDAAHSFEGPNTHPCPLVRWDLTTQPPWPCV